MSSRCVRKSLPYITILFLQGYRKLKEDHGFTKMCIINISNHASVAAAYAASIIHRGPSPGSDEHMDMQCIDKVSKYILCIS